MINSAVPKFSQRWQWGSKQAISFLMEQGVQNPGCISLAAGLVDQKTLPVELVRGACEQVTRDLESGRVALQYGTTPGAERLRKQLLQHLAGLEGVPGEQLGVGTDRVVLTTGSQQLLSLVGEVLLDPGDIVFVAAPTYFVFLGTLNGLGARMISIPSDADGMDVEALERELVRIEKAGELPRVKMIYSVSYYENPSGISLSTERRKRLVEIARRWSKHQRVLVLEDAAYRELHYDGPRLPSIWSFDPGHEYVVLAQTFSKSLSPGLRVGYGVLPRELVGPVCDRKGNEDFGSANFNQHLLATIFEQGGYEKHVKTLQQTYRTKRDAMLAAADKYFRDLDGVSWVHPHGGLYVWMTLPNRMQTGFDSALFRRAVQEGVMYVPGGLCHAGPVESRPQNQMRLSFGTQDPAGIDLGMQRLATAVRGILGESA